MPYLIIAGVLFLTSGLVTAVYKISHNEDEAVATAFGVGLFFAIVGTVIIILIIHGICGHEKREVILESRVFKLESVSTRSSLDGGFILGTGSLKSGFRYRYFVNENGVIRSREISSDRAGIVEDGTPEDSRIEKIYRRSSLPEDCWCKKWVFENEALYLKDVIFHVPPGSVRMSGVFNVN